MNDHQDSSTGQATDTPVSGLEPCASRYRVSELDGALLDAAVAMAEGYLFHLYKTHADGFRLYALHTPGQPTLGSCGRGTDGEWSENIKRYSRDWTHAGPIIERERIAIEPGAYDSGNWLAEMVHPARPDGVQRTFTTGPTPLIAAMRAYVASKLGDEIDLP